MNRYLRMLALALVTAALAACGGGGGSSGSSGGGGGGGGGVTDPEPQVPEIASMIYQLSKPAIDNGGGDTSELTVTALDADNNPVAGVPLTVSVNSGVYTPGASVTNAAGQAGGTISIGSDKSNRAIRASIRLGSERATAVVEVTGSQITLTPLPATPAPGGAVQVEIRAVDANGAVIPNVAVTLSGSLGLTGTVTTDNNGSATARLAAAPARAGSYAVKASALGVEAERAVQVVSSTGSGIPDAVGPLSPGSLAIVPNTITPNVSGSTTNRAVLRATFLNARNQAVPNVRVRFEIVQPGLGSGEKISTDDATVYTDSNGEATAFYIAGTRSSPTDGVKIRACYGLTDASIAGGRCTEFAERTLTVAGQSLSVTLGDNNELDKGGNNLTYIKMFDVAVADAAGNAVANALISASVDIFEYRKGTFDGARVACDNEDTNRNGFLDAGEDSNRNGTLEPRKADVILSFVGSNTTDATGRATIQVEYPQNVATWLRYDVKVTTNVAGSEGEAKRSYTTGFVDGDEKNGSFLDAPYGSALSCTNPN